MIQRSLILRMHEKTTAMINIAICDDDKTFTGIVEQLLRRLANGHGIPINCEVFFDGSDLIKAVTEQQLYFDLIYLDIEMHDLDGIRTALSLRKLELPVLIVYVSIHEEYLKELFYAEPFRFLSKPIDETIFSEVFFSACERIRNRTGYFTFSYKRAINRIPLSQIIYFESNSRAITIHQPKWNAEHFATQQIRFYGKMNDIEKRVTTLNGHFLRVHQSYLVNFDYIRTMSSTKLETLDGRIIQISEDRRREVRARFSALADLKGDTNERTIIT